MKKLFFILMFFASLGMNAQGRQYDGSEKLSPSLHRMLLRQQAPTKFQKARREQPTQILTLIQSDSRQVLEDEGCRIYDNIGDIYIADVPSTALKSLSQRSAVRRMEAEASKYLYNDTSRIITHTTWIQDSLKTDVPQAFTGQGVLVGLVDGGYDFTHPTFYNPDGSLAVTRFWDFFDPRQPVEGLPYGSVYDGAATIAGLEHSYKDYELNYHGTHTMGTVIGRGYQDKHRGVAYESELLCVENWSDDASLLDYGEGGRYTCAADILAFKWIFDEAERRQQPCVISFSEGYSANYSRFTTLMEECINRLIGPGRIFVVAAGNSSTYPAYLKKPASQASVTLPTSFSNQREVSMYAEADGDFSIDILIRVATDKFAQQPVQFSTADFPADQDWLFSQQNLMIDDENAVTMNVEAVRYPSEIHPDKTAYDIFVYPDEDQHGSFSASSTIKGACNLDLHLTGNNCFYNVPDTVDATNDYIIGVPGTAAEAITVGAMLHRDKFTNLQDSVIQRWPDALPGYRAPFSSIGPTLDNRIKPDIMAPGTFIYSAQNTFAGNENDYNVEPFEYNGKPYSWLVISGTSMACPHVAGIIALWLQADPTLTPAEIKDIFNVTARRNEQWGYTDYPNKEYGYGEIDAYAGLVEVLQRKASGMLPISHHQATGVSIRPVGDGLHLSFATVPTSPFTVSIYTLAGQLLSQQKLSPNTTDYQLSCPFVSGVVAVQIDSVTPSLSGSALVRMNNH